MQEALLMKNEEISDIADFLNEKFDEGYHLDNIFSCGDDSFVVILDHNDTELRRVARKKLREANKKVYGEFEHVMLTDEEIQKLKELTGDVDEWINTLDEYLENNPKKHYANHYLTIRKWYNRRLKGVTTISKKKSKKTNAINSLSEVDF